MAMDLNNRFSAPEFPNDLFTMSSQFKFYLQKTEEFDYSVSTVEMAYRYERL